MIFRWSIIIRPAEILVIDLLQLIDRESLFHWTRKRRPPHHDPTHPMMREEPHHHLDSRFNIFADKLKTLIIDIIVPQYSKARLVPPTSGTEI